MRAATSRAGGGECHGRPGAWQAHVTAGAGGGALDLLGGVQQRGVGAAAQRAPGAAAGCPREQVERAPPAPASRAPARRPGDRGTHRRPARLVAARINHNYHVQLFRGPRTCLTGQDALVERAARCPWSSQFCTLAGALRLSFLPLMVRTVGVHDPGAIGIVERRRDRGSQLAQTAAAPFWGRVADRVGRKPMVVRPPSRWRC